METGKKVALITGGAMGVGLATAKRLLKENCALVLWDINTEALKSAREELIALDANAVVDTAVCDVADKEMVYAEAGKVLQKYGKLDILVNNAGYVKGGELLEQDDAVWEKTISVNITSMVYTTKAFLPIMYERNEGFIINIASASSLLGVGGLSVYTATKWAVWGFTESMRHEALNNGKTGVHWATVHPSYIAKGMFEGAKLGGLGSLIVPLLKSHDVVAKAVVEDAIKRKAYSPKRPRSVNLTLLMRALLPDSIFQKALVLLGINNSMRNWKGREKE